MGYGYFVELNRFIDSSGSQLTERLFDFFSPDSMQQVI